MLRIVARGVRLGLQRNNVLLPKAAIVPAVQQIRASHGKQETDEEFDKRYVDYFSRPDIDHWEIRKAMNDLAGSDLVPEPVIIIAALKACRRLNDYALTTRFLESIKDSCGPDVDKIYPYILQEIRPTLNELGISTPEELGYGEPELWLEPIDHIH